MASELPKALPADHNAFIRLTAMQHDTACIAVELKEGCLRTAIYHLGNLAEDALRLRARLIEENSAQ